MPVWAWVAIVAGALLLTAASVAVGVFAWRAYERRVLLRLVVRTEAAEAAAAALLEAVSRLAASSDEDLETFAEDPDSIERRALADVRSRGSLIASELDHMPLPRRLIPVAESIADAAVVVAEEAGRVTDDARSTAALEQVSSIDLARVRGYSKRARAVLAGACEACGLDETAVYGGGLYL